MQFLQRAYERFAALIHELLKFGAVGAIAFVIDFGGAYLLAFGVGLGPIKSKVLSTIVAATFAYVGNRFWTYRHRKQSGLAREYVLFFLLNGIGLIPPMITIGFTHYTLGLQDGLSYNIAQFVGVGLGTLFRLWSYKKWVFLAAPSLAEEPAGETAEGAVERADVRPHPDVKAQADPLTTR
ncbi:GtrA family protein [Microbispora sp. NEAU-D428]|uniref:GtrA family protein n=1 Tax=Microbispora sitophila TaxID=2771537 RepID=UPI001868432B|nr:GtrA family protein [Microbispora sitophila]MBE3008882.1 GtrA family protein [Microbispora sitophila]